MRGIFMIATIYSTFSGKLAGKHPTLGVWVREDGMVFNIPNGNKKTSKYRWTFGSLDVSNGYMRIWVNNTKYLVHRLVAETFIPNPFNKPTVDHKNRVRTDNRVSNLRWYSYREQRFNSSQTDNALNLGVREIDNKSEYNKRLYRLKRKDPEYVKKRRAQDALNHRLRRAKKKAEREAQPS